MDTPDKPSPDAPSPDAGAEKHPGGQTLPEPSLKTFVSGMAGQTLISMGLFENPATGKKEVNLQQAKYSIDLLQILYDKMRGNLTDEEDKIIKSMLYDLRMRYVEVCR